MTTFICPHPGCRKKINTTTLNPKKCDKLNSPLQSNVLIATTYSQTTPNAVNGPKS